MGGNDTLKITGSFHVDHVENLVMRRLYVYCVTVYGTLHRFLRMTSVVLEFNCGPIVRLKVLHHGFRRKRLLH